MRIAEGKDSDRDRFSPEALELAGLLHDWDPIGVYCREDQNPDPGEYDDLVLPILQYVRTAAGRESLAVDLRDVLSQDYGMSEAEGVEEFSALVVTWWLASHHDVA